MKMLLTLMVMYVHTSDIWLHGVQHTAVTVPCSHSFYKSKWKGSSMEHLKEHCSVVVGPVFLQSIV